MAAPGKHAQAERIDTDGLPHIGAVVWPKQSYYTTVDTLTGASPTPHIHTCQQACARVPSGTIR